MANERPLDEAALDRLREDLAAGKRPSLVLLSGGAGVPAGSRGQLVRIDDPPGDAEFLHVKVGNDELPFAPEEVALPGRRTRTAGGRGTDGRGTDSRGTDSRGTDGRAWAGEPAQVARTEPPPILEPVRPDRRTRAERVVEPPPPPAEPEVSEPIGPGGEPSGAAAEETPQASRRTRRNTRAASGPPRMTLTLRFADFVWTVEALVGGRRDKPSAVPLAAIRAFADQLEDQALRRQLESTVEACRTEAQKRAATLREELARLETELAALDD